MADRVTKAEEPAQIDPVACATCGGSMETSEHMTLRGHHYIIRELSAEEYEAVTGAANSPGKDGDLETDMNVLRKMLVITATTEDGKQLTPATQGKMPQPVYAKLDIIARRMHWGEMESEEEAAEAAKTRGDAPSP